MVNQTDFGMPVYNLQQMLRTIFQVRGMEPEVIADGFFNETTQTAVQNFQRMKNMDVTGVVDNETWDAIVQEYDIAIIDGGEPISVQLFTREDFTVADGGMKMRLRVLQAMMQVMQARFSNLPQVEVTGMYDAQTRAALDTYRMLFNLPQGAPLDNQFWYQFAKAYESAVLPYDFENPQNNRYDPNEARQQIDLSVRNENSMPEAMGEEMLTAPQAQMANMPILDSYQTIRDAQMQEQTVPQIQPVQETVPTVPQTQQMRETPPATPQMQRNDGRTQQRAPLKWNF